MLHIPSIFETKVCFYSHSGKMVQHHFSYLVFFFNEETLLIEEVFCSYQFLTKVVDSKQQVVPANFPGQWSCPGQRMRMLVM